MEMIKKIGGKIMNWYLQSGRDSDEELDLQET